MIQGAMMTDSGPIGFIGINDENLRRMKAGMPLDINVKKITPIGTRINRVIIHYGHTYEDVVLDMKESNLPVDESMIQLAKDMDARILKERRKKGN